MRGTGYRSRAGPCGMAMGRRTPVTVRDEDRIRYLEQQVAACARALRSWRPFATAVPHPPRPEQDRSKRHARLADRIALHQ